MAWTRFMDMHSGGGQKEKWSRIYIEAPQEEAELIFFNRFGHNPNRVTCTCCGNDYSASEAPSLEEASAYDRNCRFDKEKKTYVEETGTDTWSRAHIPFETWLKTVEDKLVVYAKDIKPEERQGELREQGYIWQD
jgi:hypothetical protein